MSIQCFDVQVCENAGRLFFPVDKKKKKEKESGGVIACSNVKCHTRDPFIEKCVSPLKNVLLDPPYVGEKNEAADSAAAESTPA